MQTESAAPLGIHFDDEDFADLPSNEGMDVEIDDEDEVAKPILQQIEEEEDGENEADEGGTKTRGDESGEYKLRSDTMAVDVEPARSSLLEELLKDPSQEPEKGKKKRLKKKKTFVREGPDRLAEALAQGSHGEYFDASDEDGEATLRPHSMLEGRDFEGALAEPKLESKKKRGGNSGKSLIERQELEQKSVQVQLLREENIKLPERKTALSESAQTELLNKLKQRQAKLSYAPLDVLTQRTQSSQPQSTQKKDQASPEDDDSEDENKESENDDSEEGSDDEVSLELEITPPAPSEGKSTIAALLQDIQASTAREVPQSMHEPGVVTLPVDAMDVDDDDDFIRELNSDKDEPALSAAKTSIVSSPKRNRDEKETEKEKIQGSEENEKDGKEGATAALPFKPFTREQYEHCLDSDFEDDDEPIPPPRTSASTGLRLALSQTMNMDDDEADAQGNLRSLIAGPEEEARLARESGALHRAIFAQQQKDDEDRALARRSARDVAAARRERERELLNDGDDDEDEEAEVEEPRRGTKRARPEPEQPREAPQPRALKTKPATIKRSRSALLTSEYTKSLKRETSQSRHSEESQSVAVNLESNPIEQELRQEKSLFAALFANDEKRSSQGSGSGKEKKADDDEEEDEKEHRERSKAYFERMKKKTLLKRSTQSILFEDEASRSILTLLDEGAISTGSFSENSNKTNRRTMSTPPTAPFLLEHSQESFSHTAFFELNKESFEDLSNSVKSKPKLGKATSTLSGSAGFSAFFKKLNESSASASSSSTKNSVFR